MPGSGRWNKPQKLDLKFFSKSCVSLWWMGRAGILLTYPVVGRFWCVGLSVVWSTLEQNHLLSKKQKWYEMIRLCRFKKQFLGHFRAWGRVPAMTKPTCSKGPTFKLLGTPRHSPTLPFQYPKNMFDFNHHEKMSFSAGAWLENSQIIDISCEVFASCRLVFFLGCPFFNDFQGTPGHRIPAVQPLGCGFFAIGVEAVCPFMIYGEIVQRWRVAGGAELQKWPSSVEKYGGWFLYILFYGILMWEVRDCDI